MSDTTQTQTEPADDWPIAEHTRREPTCPRCGEPASRYGGGLCADCATDDLMGTATDARAAAPPDKRSSPPPPERDVSETTQDAAELQREVERLRGWIREIQYDSEGHHDGERNHALAHALAVEIPYLCDEALDGKPLPQLTHDRVPVCTSTGEVGCLGCTEGICDGMTAYDWRTFCACGGDDVYGEMHHFEGCALHDPDDD